MTNLIIVGAGGFGLEVEAYAHDIDQSGTKSITVKGFLDDTKEVGTPHGLSQVLGPIEGVTIEPNAHYIIALGNPQSRHLIAEKLAKNGARFATLVHPLAYCAQSAELDVGTILAPFSFAGPKSIIGKHCLLNIYASVAHECRIGDYCTLAPYAGMHATSELADDILLASHTTLTNGIKMSSGSKLAAGSIAYNDVPENAFALGNPARIRTQD